MMRQGVTIFAGDVGGTKVHLGLYSFAEGKLEHIRDRQFPAKEFSSLEEIAKQFLGADRPSLGCFGVTGPVRDGRLRLTQKYNGRVSYDRVISGSGLTNFFEFCATSAAWKRHLGSGNGFLRRLLTPAFLILEKLKDGTFMKAFIAKGRLIKFLTTYLCASSWIVERHYWGSVLCKSVCQELSGSLATLT